MIKAIFFDVDGTLLSFKTHSMPKSTRDSLALLREKGIKLFVATGRSPVAFKGLMKVLDFEFDGFVFSNGQYVVVEDKVIRDTPLPKDNLAKLIEYIDENNIATQFSEMGYTYANFMNERIEELHNFLGRTAPNMTFDDMKRVFDNDTYQLSAYITKEEEEAFFEIAPDLRGVRWNPLFTDVIPRDGGKAVGIEKVLEYFDLSKDDCMAFGDGGNDTEMLAFLKHGIAMGNAVDAAKEVSEYVTAHVDDDGIYKALVRYGVIEEK